MSRSPSPENSPAGARAYEKVLRSKISRGEPLVTVPEAPSKGFAQFAAEWFDSYVSVNNKPSERATKATILRIHLLPWFGTLALDAITALAIEKYKASRIARGLAAKTVNNHLTVLRKCLQSAVDWNLLDTLPKVTLLHTVPPRRDFLTIEEAVQLVRAADDPVWRAMILLALRTGMRFSELSGLEWQDVDLASGVIAVRRSIVVGVVTSPKSHRERMVAIPMSVRDALTAVSGRREGLVFSRTPGYPVLHHGAIKALHKICDRAGLRTIGWHTLRHTCASHLGMLRGTLLEAQRLLGHSSLAMTERYTHLMPNALHEAVAELDQAAASVPVMGTRWATPAIPPAGELVSTTNMAPGLGSDKQKHIAGAMCSL